MWFKLNFSKIMRSEKGNNLIQYLCTITGTLTVITTSMHTNWPVPFLPQLLGNSSYISISNSEGSWILAFMYMGYPLGAVLTFLTIDIFGRKKVILLTAVPLAVSWIAIAYANIVEVIYMARLLVGIADGVVFTAIPVYLCEIANSKIRGFIGSTTTVSKMIGALLMNALAEFCNVKVASLISVAVPVLFFATFIWMPESPYFLIMSKQKEAARNNLMLLSGRSNVDKDINRLTQAVENSNVSLKLSTLLFTLFKIKSNNRALLILIGLRTFQVLTGFNAITMYSQILFGRLNGVIPSNVMTTIYFSIQFTFTVISSALVDRVGRKPLLIISIIGTGLSHLIQGTYYLIDDQMNLSHLHTIPILSLLLLVAFYNLGMDTITMLMLGELFPTGIKAFALCLIQTLYGTIAAVFMKLFQIMKDELRLFIPFYVFAGCCVVALLFIIRLVPETKGKTLEEIQEHLCAEKVAVSEANRAKKCSKLVYA